MREIKFRAWEIGNEKMSYDVYFDNLEIWILNKDGDAEIIGDRDCWEETILQLCTLCQYTGLKDKNGREIYEGDVLKHESLTLKEIVEWKEQMWTEEGFMTGFGEWWGTSDQYEIIGNIYENPELLEDK